MPRLRTLLATPLALLSLAAAAGATPTNTWIWNPGPLVDDDGRLLSPAEVYEVYLAVDARPESLVAVTADTFWRHAAVPGRTYVACVRAVDAQGRTAPMSEPSDPWTAPTNVSGVPRSREMALGPAHPNPFNPLTTLSYTIPDVVHGPVVLRVLDVRGRHVRTLRAERTPGEHAVRWDGTDDGGGRVASGVYLVQLRVGAASRVKKVTLVR